MEELTAAVSSLSSTSKSAGEWAPLCRAACDQLLSASPSPPSPTALTRLLSAAAQVELSPEGLAKVVEDAALAEALVPLYAAERDALRAAVGPLPAFPRPRDFRWRLDMDLGSGGSSAEAKPEEVEPVVTGSLGLAESETRTSELLVELAPEDLLAMTKSLEQALQASRTAQFRKLQNAFPKK